MKLLKLSILGAVLSVMSVACSDDNTVRGDDPVPTPESGDAVYMGMTIEMPGAKGARSETIEPGQSNDGNEVGTADENKVDNVIIVLARATDNAFIVAGTVPSTNLVAVGEDNSYRTTAKLEKTRLASYYSQANIGASNNKVNVFVFCNPTQEIREYLAGLNSSSFTNTEWLDQTCSVIEGNLGEQTREAINTGIWGKGSFLMTNSEIAQRELPRSIDDWNFYKSAATAFDLSGLNRGGSPDEVDNSAAVANGGAVKVQRCVARFDFRDGSPNGDNTYDVVMTKGRDSKTLIQVQLQKMGLTNMSNKFYYLHRTSADGTTSGATILGRETALNYIVGPYANDFQGEITTTCGNYFNFPFFNAQGTYQPDNNDWYISSIENVLKGQSDNWEGNANIEKNSYKVWRYVTENVIPAQTSNQQKGITTTVVFKGKMIAHQNALDSEDTQVQEMAKYLNNVDGILTGNSLEDPILYSFNGSLYFRWSHVRQEAIRGSVEVGTNEEGQPVITNIDRSATLYVAVFGNGGVGTFKLDGVEYTDDKAIDPTCADQAWQKWNDAGRLSDDNLKNMRDKMTHEGFTIYQSSIDNTTRQPGYYCYYFYYNRHNDNGKPGIMGPMEFCVVRNNVYKLAVTKISQLGHPRNPDNDPDSPDPDDPDESDNIYMTVTCRVLPWVVRVNNIEF